MQSITKIDGRTGNPFWVPVELGKSMKEILYPTGIRADAYVAKAKKRKQQIGNSGEGISKADKDNLERGERGLNFVAWGMDKLR